MYIKTSDIMISLKSLLDYFNFSPTRPTQWLRSLSHKNHFWLNSLIFLNTFMYMLHSFPWIKNPRINSVLKYPLYCIRLKDTAQYKNFMGILDWTRWVSIKMIMLKSLARCSETFQLDKRCPYFHYQPF